MTSLWNPADAAADLFRPIGARTTREKAADTLAHFKRAVTHANVTAFYASARILIVHYPDAAADALRWCATLENVSPAIQEAFSGFLIADGTEWGGNVAHRDLVSAVRAMMPTYLGAPVTLYRGEDILPAGANRHGLFWAPDMRWGRWHMRSERRAPAGTVLLRTLAPPEAILGVMKEGTATAEYLVDYEKLDNIERAYREFPTRYDAYPIPKPAFYDDRCKRGDCKIACASCWSLPG